MRKFLIFIFIFALLCSLCVFSSSAVSSSDTLSVTVSNSYSGNPNILVFTLPSSVSSFVSSHSAYALLISGSLSTSLSFLYFDDYQCVIQSGGSLQFQSYSPYALGGIIYSSFSTISLLSGSSFFNEPAPASTVTLSLTFSPLFSSDSSSGVSFPSSSSTVYKAGIPQAITSSLSRQSFNFGIDRSGDFVTPVLAESDYFQYPNVVVISF